MNYLGLYTDFLKKHVNVTRPLTVVCDASNGTAGLVLKELTTIPNLNLILINDTPDPEFSAHGPNPLEAGATDDTLKKVLETKADLGVIFDADADRAFFVDDKGIALPSHLIAILLFKNNPPPYAADELVFQSLRHMNLENINQVNPSRIGAMFVKEVLKNANGTVGAEYSGHYFFKEFFGTDSGIFTMIQVLNTLSQHSGPLSDFFKVFSPQVLVSETIKLEGVNAQDIISKLEAVYSDEKQGKRDGLTLDFGDRWISIRSSNTEPILRFIAGSPSEKESKALILEVRSKL